jgi:methylase of polypeptide subunit release factors
MGSCESVLPLTTVSGREITTDTLLLAELAGDVPCRVCFDLGTGTGEVLKNAGLNDSFSVGIDVSFEALKKFDRAFGQPVNCPVEMVSSFFSAGCADLVLANPPYNTSGKGRISLDPLRREAREGNSLLVYRFIFAGAYLLEPGGCMIITGKPAALSITETGMRAAGFYRLERFEKRGVSAIKAVLLRKP